MKILSNPAGDALLTNAEVMHWLRQQNNGDGNNNDQGGGTDGGGDIPLPSNARVIRDDLLDYFTTSPSANQSMQSVGDLFKKLKKYKLSDPELLMIANIRPEAYAHITPLIADIYNRFDYDTIMEILKVVNNTLEPRPAIDNVEEQEQVENDDGPAAHVDADGDIDNVDDQEGEVIKKEFEEAGDGVAD